MRRYYRRNISLSSFIILLSAFFLYAFMPSAQAQKTKISEAEKAVFMFFKMAQAIPDYERWITESPTYLEIDDKKIQKDFLEEETMRLKWGFGTFDAADRMLRIKTDAIIKLSVKGSKSTLEIQLPEMSKAQIPYFPYPYGKQWIALVIDDLVDYLVVPLTPEETQKLIEIMTPLKTNQIRAEMRLRIKPVKADLDKPMDLDGAEQWLMLGETGLVEIVYKQQDSGEEAVLWSLMKPWYMTDTEKELLPLLED